MFNRSSSLPTASTASTSYHWASMAFTNNNSSNFNLHNIQNDILHSTELIFRSKLTWLLIFGPIALVGKSGIFGESLCFILAGLTLIPFAERLSFVTEEVASHTNQTIGALLNATFGNAPELLISSAALQEGYYRVVQLTLLGSMLTNLLFVFGLSCLIGGFRFQVQELRIVSGNASIGMLMLAVAGLALPAALMLSDEMISSPIEKEYIDKNGDGKSDINDGPTYSMVGFSRFNAVIMIVGYLLYLLFQLGSHKDEFEDLEEENEEDEATRLNNDEEEGQSLQQQRISPKIKTKKKAKKNKFCHRLFFGYRGIEDDDDINASRDRGLYQHFTRLSSIREMEMSPRAQQDDANNTGEVDNNNILSGSQSLPDYIRNKPGISTGERSDIPQSRSSDLGRSRDNSIVSEDDTVRMSNVSNHRRRISSSLMKSDGEGDSSEGHVQFVGSNGLILPEQSAAANGRSSRVGGGGGPTATSNKSHCSDGSDEEPYIMSIPRGGEDEEEGEFTNQFCFILHCNYHFFSHLNH